MPRKRRKHPRSKELEQRRKLGEAVFRRNLSSVSDIELKEQFGHDAGESESFRRSMEAGLEERNPQIQKLEDDLREASKQRIFGRKKPSVEGLITFLEGDSVQPKSESDRSLLSHIVEVWCNYLDVPPVRRHEIRLRTRLLSNSEVGLCDDRERLTGQEMVKRLIEQHGMSRSSIARELGTDPSHISKIADGRVKQPREDKVQALKELLKVKNE